MLSALSIALALLVPHDGPDPIGSWRLSSQQVRGTELVALLGVTGRVDGEVEFIEDALGDGLYFDGKTTRVVLADDSATSEQALPQRHMTVSAWVSVNTPQPWGGIIGTLQDNGGAETGWILGYNASTFTFGLSTTGADDGDGRLTYVAGKTKYEEGRYYHVVATFDGQEQRLYVDGTLDASSRVQSGDVLYPATAPIVVGGYLDRDESFFHHGRIRSARLFDQAANDEWVRGAFEHQRELKEGQPHVWVDPQHRWVVEPYLQWATTDGMTVRWETSRPATSTVHYGEAVRWEGEGPERVGHFPHSVSSAGMSKLHEVRIPDLRADQAHYYRVETVDSLGRTLESPISSFQTAPEAGTPFAFVVISDTQGNPEINGKIARLAWAQRPSFVLHPGDLVDTGSTKQHWIDEFFASMKPLFERVAFFPVLGNHEQDAKYYYDYVSLPDPEYYYTFSYGNAQFFLIDSNREVGPASEQYAWLAEQLASSQAEWKIVCYHHPAYTSDENDYGDTWSGPSARGDERMRALVPLYDRHGVDIVWNGHIHSYERTWPLRAGRAAEEEGTIYMVTGGGGGSLETAGPIRPWFQNNVKRGHHYCFVAVNGKTLEMRAFTDEGALFDTFTIRKK
jgi:predicted phosphodiesterase